MAYIEGLQLQFLIQPQPVTNGTNSLGLTPGESDIVTSVITAAYADAADDYVAQEGIQAIFDRHVDLLRSEGLDTPLQYLSYGDMLKTCSVATVRISRRLYRQLANTTTRTVYFIGVHGGFKLFK